MIPTGEFEAHVTHGRTAQMPELYKSLAEVWVGFTERSSFGTPGMALAREINSVSKPRAIPWPRFGIAAYMPRIIALCDSLIPRLRRKPARPTSVLSLLNALNTQDHSATGLSRSAISARLLPAS